MKILLLFLVFNFVFKVSASNVDLDTQNSISVFKINTHIHNYNMLTKTMTLFLNEYKNNFSFDDKVNVSQTELVFLFDDKIFYEFLNYINPYALNSNYTNSTTLDNKYFLLYDRLLRLYNTYKKIKLYYNTEDIKDNSSEYLHKEFLDEYFIFKDLYIQYYENLENTCLVVLDESINTNTKNTPIFYINKTFDDLIKLYEIFDQNLEVTQDDFKDFIRKLNKDIQKISKFNKNFLQKSNINISIYKDFSNKILTIKNIANDLQKIALSQDMLSIKLNTKNPWTIYNITDILKSSIDELIDIYNTMI